MNALDIAMEDSRWDDLGLETLADRAITAALTHLAIDPELAEVSILACDDARIAELNADFRGKPQPTNVLGWPADERGADIDGVEVTLDLRANDYVSFNSSISYNDATLAELLPDSFAPGGGYAAGTTLPGASEWTVSNGLEFRFPDVAFDPRLAINHRYVSEAPVAFGATLMKGDYHLFDVNVSAEVRPGIEVDLFVKNATDEYGILNAPFSFAGSVTRPRTIGASLRVAFD